MKIKISITTESFGNCFGIIHLKFSKSIRNSNKVVHLRLFENALFYHTSQDFEAWNKSEFIRLLIFMTLSFKV